MPGDDYKAAVGGGLKLKGVSPSSKVSKHKKKKPKPESNPTAEEKPKNGEASSPTGDGVADEVAESSTITRKKEETLSLGEAATPPPRASKTEAELRHEESRRKRLDERLKREGTKTHKERVEELNRYLSNLSEHHDMPRIGPG